jgi:putative transposase
MKYRRQAHVVYKTKYHVVWIPKYRRKILVGGVGTYCEKVIRRVLTERYPDVVVEVMTIQPDYVHMMIEIPPKYAVSTVVGVMKGETSREMRKKFGYIGNANAMWSIGYFVSTVGANEGIIRRYIEEQEKQDTGRALLELDDTMFCSPYTVQ